MKLLCIFTAALILTGCATDRINQIPKSYIGKGGTAVVLVNDYNFQGSGIDYFLTLNSDDVVKIGIRKKHVIALPAGKHQIGVRCFGGIFPISHYSNLDIQITDDETVYLLISNDKYTACADVKLLNEVEVKKKVSGTL